jgi:hypothetical protein
MKISFVQMRAAAAACPLTLGLTSLAVSQTADSVELRILAINDFHGNLRPPPGGIRITDPDDSTRKTVVPAGGAEWPHWSGNSARAQEHHLRRGRRSDPADKLSRKNHIGGPALSERRLTA